VQLADAIQEYLDCVIDNFTLDDLLASGQTADAVCEEIGGEMWFLYDDCSRHRNSGKFKIRPDDDEAVRRWIVLLRSSADWNWPRCHSAAQPLGGIGLLPRLQHVLRRQTPALSENQFWPWADQADWSRWTGASDVRR